ncbi:magnesium transporter, partial [Candidatus Roizmanbacteria bacterium]|nr:magnesium transporter [Candidatus Roizmanbacteria bacterium]
SISELEENELFLLKNIQDKQIIDLKGNKVVRVNDVVLQDKNGLYVSGVDISLLGIFRWLKLEKYFHKLANFVNYRPISQFLSWADIQPLELARGQVRLKKEEQKLEKLRPEDLADYLEKTNVVNTRKILKILDKKFAADVIRSLNINYQTSLFKYFTPEIAAKFISLIDPDEAVDIILTQSPKKREQIIRLLGESKKTEINHLLKLSNTPIGELITTEYLTVSPEETVKSVITKVRRDSADFFTLLNIYVVNKDNQLIGVFNIHELLLQDDNTQVYKFMIQNVIVVHLTTPVEIVIRKMFKYHLLHLPVIDISKKIQGIITMVDVDKFVVEKL